MGEMQTNGRDVGRDGGMWERGEGCRDVGRGADKDAGRDAGRMDGSWQTSGRDAGKDAGSQEDYKEPGRMQRVPHTAGSSVGLDTKPPHEARGKSRMDPREPGGGSRTTLPCSRQEEASQCPAE